MKKLILSVILLPLLNGCIFQVGAPEPATRNDNMQQSSQPFEAPISSLTPTPTPTATQSKIAITDTQMLGKIKQILATSKTMDRSNLATCGQTMRRLKEELQPIRETAESSLPGSNTRQYLAPITIDLGLAITCDAELASNAIKQVDGAVKIAEKKIL
jgi:hypothetical protein